MQSIASVKFGFRIRTRAGAIVDNLVIVGRDETEAERKLRQMYIGCEIIDRRTLSGNLSRNGLVDYEDVIDLISGR